MYSNTYQRLSTMRAQEDEQGEEDDGNDSSRAGKLPRGSRAGSSSERLVSLERAEPSPFFELVFAASRAGSFQLASLAKMINLWNNNEY
jgi:hypothetical protein